MIQRLGSTSVKSTEWKIGSETEFIQMFEGKEGYTTLYSFYNLPENTEVISNRKEAFLKECVLCFDRLVFDLDSGENPFDAVEQGIALREFFKLEFPDLYTEIWFSGSKGCHVYVYFQPIAVKNPKLIYARIFDRLKNVLGFNYLDSALKNTYAGLIRAKNSRHPKTGYYKCNITNAIDLGKITCIEDVYNVASSPTVSYPKFNNDVLFTELINELDKSFDEKSYNYDDFKEYTVTGEMDLLKEAFLHVFKEGNMNLVSYPLIHMFRRAKVPKEDVYAFFDGLGVNFNSNKISQYIETSYSTLGRICGLTKLKENWLEAGASPEDLQAVYNFFTISDDVFYPYKANPISNVDLLLPDGWEVTEKEETSVFTVKKGDMIVSFDVRDYLVVNGKKIMFDKRTLHKDIESYDITVPEILDLEYSKKIFVNQCTDDFKLLKSELNTRLTSTQKKKTAQTILNYFANRQGFSTPKGTMLMGTDNIGRLLTDNDLKSLLNKDFQPNQILTSDLLHYINDLPERLPDYNILRTANGFYDFNTGEFKTKADKPTFTFKNSSYNYRIEMIGTPIPDDLQLLFDNLHNCSIKALLQVIGYALTDGNPLKIIPIFIGDNNTGKSVILNLTGALLNNNTSSIDIFNIEETDHELVDKDLNIISEFRGTNKKGLALLKQYSGNEPLTLKLLYKNKESCQPETISKTIISTNELHELREYVSRSTYDRFTCYIEFKKSYTGEPDTGILDRILDNSDAMDWLLTNAINAYVNCNGVLEASHSVLETKKLIQYYDNPIENDILEAFEYVPYPEQEAYAKILGYKNMDDREFLIEYGVTSDDIKEFYDLRGEIPPKQLMRKLKEIFDDKNIERTSRTVDNERIVYIIGLIRK